MLSLRLRRLRTSMQTAEAHRSRWAFPPSSSTPVQRWRPPVSSATTLHLAGASSVSTAAVNSTWTQTQTAALTGGAPAHAALLPNLRRMVSMNLNPYRGFPAASTEYAVLHSTRYSFSAPKDAPVEATNPFSAVGVVNVYSRVSQPAADQSS